MSLNVPSTLEVMRWDPQTLADYMNKLNLPGCDKVVIKGSISGAQFMQMSECDLQMFPSLYVPRITEFHSEVRKDEQKRSSNHRSKAQQYPPQVFAQEEENWECDEFDNDSDENYDSADHEEGEDNYIFALTERQTVKQQNSDRSNKGNLKLPSSSHTRKPPLDPNLSPDHHFRDRVHAPSPAQRISKPPVPSLRMNPALQKPVIAPAGQLNLHKDRRKKPQQSVPSKEDLPKSILISHSHYQSCPKEGSTVKSPASSNSKSPKPTDTSNKVTKLTPAPPVPAQRVKFSNTKPGPRQGLDPSWYGGKVTRHQAEAILREVNKDGAFVVRDSTKGTEEHPYTLMLLKEDKVYNIMIRSQSNGYSLGTGTKIFPGVKEMIAYHTVSPLQLLDAAEPSSDAQSKPCLLHPVGL